MKASRPQFRSSVFAVSDLYLYCSHQKPPHRFSWHRNPLCSLLCLNFTFPPRITPCSYSALRPFLFAVMTKLADRKLCAASQPDKERWPSGSSCKVHRWTSISTSSSDSIAGKALSETTGTVPMTDCDLFRPVTKTTSELFFVENYSLHNMILLSFIWLIAAFYWQGSFMPQKCYLLWQHFSIRLLESLHTKHLPSSTSRKIGRRVFCVRGT